LRPIINRGLDTGASADSTVGPLTGLIAGPVSPEVRSRLLQILLETKGVTTDKSAKDSRGRAGVAAEERVDTTVYRTVFSADATPLESVITQGGKVVE